MTSVLLVAADARLREQVHQAIPGASIFLAQGGSYARLDAKAGGTGGSWAWAPAFLDLDLDGRLDLYCCSGYVTGDTPADT